MIKQKINTIYIIKYYLVLFGLLMLVYCSLNKPIPIGEWDDYSLPVASLLNDYNFSITEDDIAFYKKVYPEWESFDNYSLSGYMTKNGSGELTWYFPVYAILCTPLTVLLYLLHLPTIFAFPYSNLSALMISFYVVYKCLKCDESRKLLLLLILSLNPIVFYISWTSAEVVIYALLVISLAFWYNRWYHRAALFISIAGMLNPTIMSIGLVMIAEWFVFFGGGQ